MRKKKKKSPAVQNQVASWRGRGPLKTCALLRGKWRSMRLRVLQTHTLHHLLRLLLHTTRKGRITLYRYLSCFVGHWRLIVAFYCDCCFFVDGFCVSVAVILRKHDWWMKWVWMYQFVAATGLSDSKHFYHWNLVDRILQGCFCRPLFASSSIRLSSILALYTNVSYIPSFTLGISKLEWNACFLRALCLWNFSSLQNALKHWRCSVTITFIDHIIIFAVKRHFDAKEKTNCAHEHSYFYIFLMSFVCLWQIIVLKCVLY